MLKECPYRSKSIVGTKPNIILIFGESRDHEESKKATPPQSRSQNNLQKQVEIKATVPRTHGFKNLEIPNKRDRCFPKKTIDLYPIQMCGKVEAKGDQPGAPGTSATNIEKYTQSPSLIS
ncbi:BTE_collapsed_G0004270.mRNA.1.CDS.1 [Saccharomyces cerevisiae]|nr:BTE_collapsed_G0004270.mRNA.1.CDS.1 [Saccharomyces cerevisiae]